MKIATGMEKFSKHYSGNKKPTFLACNTEKVHTAIWGSSKINSLLQNPKSTLAGSLKLPEISSTWFL